MHTHTLACTETDTHSHRGIQEPLTGINRSYINYINEDIFTFVLPCFSSPFFLWGSSSTIKLSPHHQTLTAALIHVAVAPQLIRPERGKCLPGSEPLRSHTLRKSYLEPKRVLQLSRKEKPLKNPYWFHIEPFWVPCRTLSTEDSTWNPKGFFLERKIVILWGPPKNPFGTLVSKSGVGHA